jgi:HEPN domain-containing protein
VKIREACFLARLGERSERDLKASAQTSLDGDWRFAIAYNAALQCASLALKAAGFEVTKSSGAHHHTIESLKDPLPR